MEIENSGLPGHAISPYYTVSPARFILLSVLTLGIYQLIWFYYNWKICQENRNEGGSPFWKAFFGGFTSFSFFGKLRDEFALRDMRFGYNPAIFGFVVLTGGPLAALPGFLFLTTYLSVIPIFLANGRLMAYNRRVVGVGPFHEKMGLLQWGLLFLGGCLLYLSVTGALTGRNLMGSRWMDTYRAWLLSADSLGIDSP